MKKKLTKLVAVNLLVASQILLASCSNYNEKASTELEKYSPDSHLDVTWTSGLHTASPPTDSVVNKIEDATNSEINFNWVPAASYEERISAMLASGETTDMITLVLNNSSVRNALKAGMFWDVTDYLDDYENLKLISKEMREGASLDGRLYGIPLQKPVARSGLIIRKDWLDNLGMKPPTNLDELYEVARAFTEDDPDGNGKDDTFGISDRNDLRFSSFRTISSYQGAPNLWKVDENGQFIPEFETDEYKNAMNYSRKLYENGYIDRDFAVTAKMDQQQKFAQGKAGIYTGMVDIANLKEMAKGIQDEMELIAVNKIASPNGKYHIWSESNGVGGLIAFSKSEVKSESELKRLLQFVNDLIDKEVYMMMTAGVEGLHYENEKNGAIKIIDTGLWQKDVQPLSSSRPSEITHTIIDSDPNKRLVNELIKENAEFAVLDPTLPLDSATVNERGSELEKIIIDATFKYIMGQLDEKGFNAEVEKWKKSGGDKIAKEYEEAYKKTQN